MSTDPHPGPEYDPQNWPPQSTSLGPIRAATEKPDLEALLVAMLSVGKPRVSFMDSGWCCVCHMNVTAAGTKFEIRSEFGKESPLAAAIECASRIIEQLENIKAKTV